MPVSVRSPTWRDVHEAARASTAWEQRYPPPRQMKSHISKWIYSDVLGMFQTNLNSVTFSNFFPAFLKFESSSLRGLKKLLLPHFTTYRSHFPKRFYDWLSFIGFSQHFSSGERSSNIPAPRCTVRARWRFQTWSQPNTLCSQGCSREALSETHTHTHPEVCLQLNNQVWSVQLQKGLFKGLSHAWGEFKDLSKMSSNYHTLVQMYLRENAFRSVFQYIMRQVLLLLG